MTHIVMIAAPIWQALPFQKFVQRSTLTKKVGAGSCVGWLESVDVRSMWYVHDAPE